MAAHTGFNYDDVMRDAVQRMDISKLSRRSSGTSFSQTSRRHSARVEKPRSLHPSPRTPERRRPNFTATKKYSSLEDHYRRMMGLDEEDEDEVAPKHNTQPSTRPVSWHPGTTQTHLPTYNYTTEYAATISAASHYGPIQTSPAYRSVQIEPTWSQYMHGEVTAPTTEAYTATATVTAQDTSSWYDDVAPPIDHAALSQTITAWQANTYEAEARDDQDRATREQSEELIGLGLYDEPGFTVKIGSKLEEECDPPEEMEDADADGSSEEDEEELPKPDDSTSMPVIDMSGHSFFMADDDSAANGWWPEQAKQPIQQVRPMSYPVNYGWL